MLLKQLEMYRRVCSSQSVLPGQLADLSLIHSLSPTQQDILFACKSTKGIRQYQPSPSITLPFTRSLSHSLVLSLIHSFSLPFTRSLSHSLVLSLVLSYRTTYRLSRIFSWPVSPLKVSTSTTLRSRTFHLRWWTLGVKGRRDGDGLSVLTLSPPSSSSSPLQSMTRWVYTHTHTFLSL